MSYTPSTSPTNFENEVLIRLSALEQSTAAMESNLSTLQGSTSAIDSNLADVEASIVSMESSLTAIQSANAVMESSLTRLSGSSTEGYTQDTALVEFHTVGSSSYTVVANNSVYFEVPEGEEWIIHSLSVYYVSSATVGNRLILVSASPPAASSYLSPVTAPSFHTASQSKYYLFAPGMPFSAAVDSSFPILSCPLPPLVLQSFQRLMILDRNNISTSDAITPRLLIRKRLL